MRRALSALVVIAGLLAACSTVGLLTGRDALRFSQADLQQRLSQRFPRNYVWLGGLVTVTLMHPRLAIPPGDTRIRLDFDVAIGALGRASRTPDGTLTLTSALRYDPATRGLHLFEPRLDDVRLATLGGRIDDTLRATLNDGLSDWARREPIDRFDDSLPGRLGARRVTGTTIEDGQVVVQLGD